MSALRVLLLLAALAGCAVGWFQQRKGTAWARQVLVGSATLGIVVALLGLGSGSNGRTKTAMRPALAMSDALGHGLAARLVEDLHDGAQVLVLVPVATRDLEVSRRDAFFDALKDGLGGSSIRLIDGLTGKEFGGLPMSALVLSESGVSDEMLKGWVAEHDGLHAVVAYLPSLEPPRSQTQLDALPPLYLVVNGQHEERWTRLAKAGKVGGVIAFRPVDPDEPLPDQEKGAWQATFDHCFAWSPAR